MSDECPTCRGAGFFSLDVDIHHPEFGKLQPCECRGHAKRLKLLRRCDLDPSKTFDSFKASFAPAAYRAARAYASQPEGILYLHGGTGGGKTHLAQAIANSVVSEASEAIFGVVPDLLFEMRASLSARGEDGYDAKLERLRTIPLLILDDYGAERATDWANELLYQVINHRYSKHLATIITSNLPPTHKHYDPRLQSRFGDVVASKIIPVVAADYRARPLADRMAA